MIFAPKMSEFYKLIIGQKFFPRFLAGGGTCPPAPVSYAYGLGTCLKLSELGKSWPPYRASGHPTGPPSHRILEPPLLPVPVTSTTVLWTGKRGALLYQLLCASHLSSPDGDTTGA